jgi:t-SNARE complex subunit (syntaxin)
VDSLSRGFMNEALYASENYNDISRSCLGESNPFLSARKADLKKGFQHLVVLVVVLVVVVVVGTRVKKRFWAAERDQCEILNCL